MRASKPWQPRSVVSYRSSFADRNLILFGFRNTEQILSLLGRAPVRDEAYSRANRAPEKNRETDYKTGPRNCNARWYMFCWCLCRWHRPAALLPRLPQLQTERRRLRAGYPHSRSERDPLNQATEPVSG